MTPYFNDTETRIIGCLMEKSVTTPDQYPLTLNALTNACNQKSGRDPVLSIQQGAVQRAVRDLQDKHLVRVEENFKSRAEKYVQRFCNTRFSDYQFDTAQYAIVCLLLLRGRQTPGELRARSGRLHAFADNDAVVAALNGLINWESGPLVQKLSRTPGRKDSEYAHLFNGAIAVSEPVSTNVAESNQTPSITRSSDLEQRVLQLEAQVTELQKVITALNDGADKH